MANVPAQGLTMFCQTYLPHRSCMSLRFSGWPFSVVLLLLAHRLRVNVNSEVLVPEPHPLQARSFSVIYLTYYRHIFLLFTKCNVVEHCAAMYIRLHIWYASPLILLSHCWIVNTHSSITYIYVLYCYIPFPHPNFISLSSIYTSSYCFYTQAMKRNEQGVLVSLHSFDSTLSSSTSCIYFDRVALPPRRWHGTSHQHPLYHPWMPSRMWTRLQVSELTAMKFILYRRLRATVACPTLCNWF